MNETWLNLNGPRLVFRSKSPALLEAVEEAWQLPRSEPCAPAAYTVLVEEGEIQSARKDAAVLFDGKMPDGLPCVITSVGAGEHYYVEDQLCVLLGEREAVLTVAPGRERLVRSSVGFQPVLAALTQSGQTFLHAAALALPTNDAVILIVGASGKGKTTTTLSLLSAGCSLITDDASIIKQANGSGCIWGMRLPLKVHRKSAAMLPWLAPTLSGTWNEEDEQPVMPQDLARIANVANDPLRTWHIHAIVGLGERSAGDHRLRSISKADMILAIAADNVPRHSAGVSQSHQFRMSRMAELVAAVPVYELNAGSDLKTLPAALLTGVGASKGMPELALQRGDSA